MIVSEPTHAMRTIVTVECVQCGEKAELVGHGPRDAVDHRCGRGGLGAVWWVRRGGDR